MQHIPVLIGPEIVRNGTWVPVLDTLLKAGFRLRRIRERTLCATTKNVITTPLRDQNDLLKTGDVQDILGEGNYVCLLLETDKTFLAAKTSLDLINQSTGPHSVRGRYGNDRATHKALFLFVPVSESHADLIRMSVF